MRQHAEPRQHGAERAAQVVRPKSLAPALTNARGKPGQGSGNGHLFIAQLFAPGNTKLLLSDLSSSALWRIVTACAER